MLDYIIVGLGLSGAALAARLEERGRTFKVFDEGKLNSSKVAGGMMNPVVLKRFTLAWNADKQLDTANAFYSALEDKVGVKFLQSVELFRKFASVEEQNNWFEAADNKVLSPFLDTELSFDINPAVPAEYGFGRVLGAKRVDTKKLLNAYSQYLTGKGFLETTRFNYDEVLVREDHVEYQETAAKRIVFCEGFGLRKNPFFDYLPLTGNKGEYIIVHSPDFKLPTTIKSSVFISPLGNDFYAVGATYNHSDKSLEPTTGAREELEAKLRKLISVPFKVVDQVAGIRPSTVDRRPVVGIHPEYHNVYCCNGFGSRGVLIAPTVADDLLQYIEDKRALPEEIDLSRFTRKWYKKLG